MCEHSTEHEYGRRRLLLLGAGATLASVTGCLGGAASNAGAPAAVALPDDATCDVCGMVLGQHPGSTAEVFYADNSPEGHDNPARFDSTWEAYQYDFQHGEQGWESAAFYVTDYSAVEYGIPTEGGDAFLSRHVEAEAFAPVEEVTYVVGSAVRGAMGRDLVAFTDEGDAEAFRADHGGELTTHGEVTPELVAGLGTDM